MDEYGHFHTGKALRVEFGLFLVVLVLALAPATLNPSKDVKLLVTYIAAFILGVTWLTGSWLEGRSFAFPKHFLAILCALLLLYFLAGVASSYTASAMVELRRLVVLTLIYLLAAQAYREPRHLQGLMVALCAGVAGSSIYGLVQLAGLDPFPWANKTVEEYTNLPGTFGNPNVAGHTMILAILVALYLSVQKATRWCVVFILLFSVHMYFTHHRAGILALSAACALACVTAVVSRRIRSPLSALYATVCIMVLFAMLAVGAVFALSKSGVPNDASLLLRFNGFFGATQMIAARPLLGFGPGSYVIENPEYWTPYEEQWFIGEALMNEHVHNEFLETAIEAGILAALVFIALFVKAVCVGLQVNFTGSNAGRKRMGLFFALFFFAFGVDALFSFNFRVPVSAAVFFVFLGAMDGICSPTTNRARTNISLRSSLSGGGLLVLLLAIFAVVETRAYAAEARFFKGKSYLQAKRYGEARAFFEQAERLSPSKWKFSQQQGMAEYQARRFPAAIERFEHSLTQNPNWISTLMPLANSYLQKATMLETDFPERRPALDNAELHAEKVLRLCEHVAAAYEILGRVAYARASILHQEARVKPVADKALLDAWREARSAMDAALKKKQKNPGPLFLMLAEAQTALGSHDFAADAYTAAAGNNPKEEKVWLSFYNHASSQNDYEAMETSLRLQAKKLEGNEEPDGAALALLNVWMAQIREAGYEDLAGALSAYRRAVAYGPDQAPVWNRFAAFGRRNDRVQEFRDAVVAANAENGNDGLPGIQVLAKVWEDKANAEVLIDSVRALAARVEESPPIQGEGVPPVVQYGWVADALLAEFQYAGVPATVSAAPIFALGKIYLDLGNPTMASNVFETVYEFTNSGEKPVVATTWTATLLALGKFDEAAGVAKTIRAEYPADPHIRLPLAALFAKARQVEEARAIYKEILAIPGVPQQIQDVARTALNAL